MCMTKQCLVCGDIFSKKIYESINYWGAKKYCSRKCSLKKTIITSQSYTREKGTVPWNKNIKYNEVMRSRLNLDGLKKGWGMNKGKKFPQFSGENHPNWKQKTIVTCEYCKKTSERPSWWVKDRTRAFCNRSCWALGTRGKGSPVFKGEQSVKKLRSRIMQLPEYVYWRVGVMIRDGHKCVLCSSKKKLEVDHIKAFALIIANNSVKNTEDARSCKELWDQDNGRTLCNECHRKTDNYLKRIKISK